MISIMENIVGAILLLFCIFWSLLGIIELVCKACAFLHDLWVRLNSAGRIVVFGIPMLIMSAAMAYGFIRYVMPLMYSPSFWIISGLLYHFSTLFTGWRNIDGFFPREPREGIYPKVSRVVFLVPTSPIWVPLYIIRMLFRLCKKLFLAKDVEER